ncbi:hypothetical protein FRX31_014007 [Thalictrum thalictroides]|uniref:Uncharacterized protein n=1 Tax=Thalictrum thalictroides TaxID=46969 RepID=A0A7J6WHN0_THATH|nr:hypothetical protein FRX31_014007 [Thalictrum thalictroides]
MVEKETIELVQKSTMLAKGQEKTPIAKANTVKKNKTAVGIGIGTRSQAKAQNSSKAPLIQ